MKALSSEEKRRAYYRYDHKDPATMVHHAAPPLDPRLNDELLKAYGRDMHGDQVIRFVYAGLLREKSYDLSQGKSIEFNGMKYPYMKVWVTNGYLYINDKGRQVRVASQTQVPAGKAYVPDRYLDQLGVMRFALEIKYTAKALVEIGHYPPLNTWNEDTYCVRDGLRFRFKPNPKGEYILAYLLQTPDKMYRDVTWEDVEKVKQQVNYQRTVSDEEYVAKKLEVMEKGRKERATNEFEEMVDICDKVIVAATS